VEKVRHREGGNQGQQGHFWTGRKMEKTVPWCWRLRLPVAE
jgi:hypothetical protein